jgi:hypothetical protein
MLHLMLACSVPPVDPPGGKFLTRLELPNLPVQLAPDAPANDARELEHACGAGCVRICRSVCREPPRATTQARVGLGHELQVAIAHQTGARQFARGITATCKRRSRGTS